MPMQSQQLRIPSVTEAVMHPAEFEVSHSIVGWTLAYVGEEVSTLISREDAEKVIRAQMEDFGKGFQSQQRE